MDYEWFDGIGMEMGDLGGMVVETGEQVAHKGLPGKVIQTY